MKKFTYLSLILFSCCLLWSGPSFAAGNGAIGSVVALRGRAEVLHNGQTRLLKLKDPLYRQDSIRTGKRSRLQLMFLDNTLISLGRDTEMKLAEYNWQPDSGKVGMKTKIKEGVFRVMGGAIAKVAPQNFTTDTPTATIGIRGSMYAGRASLTECRVVFQGGKGIFLTNDLGRVEISTPGFGSRVEANQKPDPPVRFSAEEIKQLNKDLTPDTENTNAPTQESSGKAESGTTETAATRDENAADDQTASDQASDQTASEQAATAEAPTSTSEGTEQNQTNQSLNSAGTTKDTQTESDLLTSIPDTSSTDTAGSGSIIQNTVVSDTQLQSTDVVVVDVPIPPPNDQGSSPVPDSSTTTTTPPDTSTTQPPPDTTTTQPPPDTTTTTPPPDTTTPVQLSGNASANLYDLASVTTVDNWQGPTDLTRDPVTTSQYTGTIASTFPVNFDTTGATASNNYSRITAARTVSLMGTTVPLEVSTINFLNSEDFFVLSGAAGFASPLSINGQKLGYQDLAYAGLPTTQMPTSGVGKFAMTMNGSVQYSNPAPNAVDALSAVGNVWVDYGNGTVIGRLIGYDGSLYRVKDGLPLGVASLQDSMVNADGSALVDPTLPFGSGGLALNQGLFFGNLNGNTLSNITFIAGGDRPSSTIGGGLEYNSQLLTGNIFGVNGDGIGWTMADNVFSGDSTSVEGSVSIVGAGIQEGVKSTTLTAMTYKGYATGIGEQWDSSSNTVTTSIFGNRNGQSGDFSFNIGSNGSINGALHLGSNNAELLDVTIGGTGQGVAISNNKLIAELNDTSSGQGFLFSDFGFTSKPVVFNNLSWGYWLSPTNSSGSHLDGLWIAGDQSAAVQTRLNDLLTNAQPLVGRYNGNAIMQSTDSNSDMFNDQIGSAHFEMNFNDLTFQGALDFGPKGSNQHFDILNGTIDRNGFSSKNILVDMLPSDAAGLAGNFYGAGNELDSIAGSFFTVIGTTYNSGIFGASLPATGMTTLISKPLTSGRYSSISFASGASTSTSFAGQLTGQNQYGNFIGTATDGGGNTLAVDFPMLPYDPTNKQSDPFRDSSYSVTRNILGLDRTFTPTDLVQSPTGDFAYLAVPFGSFTDPAGTYVYNELSFVGEPSATTVIPNDGIDVYLGDIQNIFADQQVAGSVWAETTPVELFINWKNKTFVGATNSSSDSPGSLSHVFFIGKVSGNQLVNVQFLGHGFDPFTQWVSAVEGSETFGQLYGSNYQGIGITDSGAMFDLMTDLSTPQTTFSSIAALHRYSDLISTAVAPTGTTTFEGYVIGLSENLQDIQNNTNQRRLFMNSDPTQFYLNIDRDQGTINGSLSAVNIDSMYPTIPEKLNNLVIGGTYGSAYINDKGFVAAIGDSTGTAIDSTGVTGPLKPAGNVLITEDPHQQYGTTYATWGYWELAYQDPANGSQYHLHEPGALWVAGERTPAADVQNLINSQAVGSYSGMAQGIQIDPNQNVISLPPGTMNMTLDFGNFSSPNAVTGNISFPAVAATQTKPGFAGVSLDVGSASLTTSGFTAQITNASSSAVNGAFYGPNAATVGGNFRADLSTGRYMGIFAGDKQ